MSLDFLVSGAAGTSLFVALVLLALLVGFILWIPPRAARSGQPKAEPAPVVPPAAVEPPRQNPILWLYFSIDGRIGRSVYWLSQIPLIAVNLLTMAMGEAGGAVATFVFVLSIVVLVASAMVSIKRCHDRDKSGWWVLLSVVPVVGWIWAIVELGCLRGTEGPNRFGPDPLAA